MRGLEIITDPATLMKLDLEEETAILVTHHGASDHKSDTDSLFDDDMDSLFDEPMKSPNVDVLHDPDGSSKVVTYVEPPAPVGVKPAQRSVPPIPGLYFDPFLRLPEILAEDLLQKCLETYFQGEDVNQVMLFERVVTDPERMSEADPSGSSPPSSGIPHFLKDLLAVLSTSLRPILPKDTHELLFPPPGTPAKARQVIVNFYEPGEGITPHVDLLDRFGDGIIGVSLGSGCVMQFVKAGKTEGATSERPPCNTPRVWDVFLPHGSVYVMSDEARFGWTHGIDGRSEDWVAKSVDSNVGRWVMRSIRVSITFRWLLPGADIVGGLEEPSFHY